MPLSIKMMTWTNHLSQAGTKQPVRRILFGVTYVGLFGMTIVLFYPALQPYCVVLFIRFANSL